MMNQKAVAAVVFSAALAACGLQNGYAQNAPAALPALPADPAAAAAPGQLPADAPGNQVAPANLPSAVPGNEAPAPLPGTLPGTLPGGPAIAPPAGPGPLPGAIPTPAPFGTSTLTAPALPGTAPEGAVPTPPPLGEINQQTADANTSGTGTAGNAATPSLLYSFLFVDDPDYGIVRQKFDKKVADNLKAAEVQRLMDARRTAQSPTGGVMIPGVTPGDMMGGLSPAEMGPMGGLPMGGGVMPGLNTEEALRAAAEWDFYYEQLELYNKYIREKLIPNAQSLPELSYEAENALQERQDLFESFQAAAIDQGSKDFNDNKEFYERLNQREDRRRAYLDWLALKQQQVEAWSQVWARQVYGTRWADGEEVRLDDWYYGTDFNSANPVTVAIDDREYVVSRNPVRDLKDGQLNVVSTNLTPYDIIDNNGELKNPVMETLRGSLVVPPAPPVYTTGGTTGTLEIVGSVTSE